MTTDNAAATVGQSTETTQVAAPELKAEARAEGGGYRAVVTEDGRVIWACNHVHFTDHSAKADAQAHLREMHATAA